MSHSKKAVQMPQRRYISIHNAVIRFLGDLPADAETRSARMFERLSEVGTDPNKIDVEHIEDKLWELKVNNPKPNRLRMRYFFIVHDDEYLVTNAYIKQTNQAPRRHIELALRRANE